MQGVGREVEVAWRGRRIHAFVPARLADRELVLDAPTAARTAAAAVEIGHAAEALTEDLEVLARLLLRSEGVASSYVEGITAPVVDVVLAEERLQRSETGPATWVASNLGAARDALAGADPSTMLSTEVLCRWHRTLMSGSPVPEQHVGRIRQELGWIGGSSPLDAHLVTPPPDELPGLLDDLAVYANRLDVDPVVQAAACHAQFELVHPFGDGNGRIGRVLVGWVLVRRLGLFVPPPVSVAIAADVGGYTSGLVLFRQGAHGHWIRWFADAVASGAKAQRDLVSRVEEIRRGWHEQLVSPSRTVRRDAAVFKALDVLPRHVVLTSQVLVDELGITRKASLATLRRLVDVGILTPYGTARRSTSGQPAGLFVSPELLGLAGSTPLR